METQQKTRNELVREAISLLTSPTVNFPTVYDLLSQAKKKEEDTTILDYQDYQIDFYLSLMTWTINEGTNSFLKLLSENIIIYNKSSGTLEKLSASSSHLELEGTMKNHLYFEISTMLVKSFLLDEVILKLSKSGSTPHENFLLRLEEIIKVTNAIIKETTK